MLGDFNIDLLRDSSNLEVENFIDTFQSNLLIPTVTLPTRITKNSKTLIDNIISSPSKFQILSGNLTVGISDHLPQFLMYGNDAYKNDSSLDSYSDWQSFDEQFL